LETLKKALPEPTRGHGPAGSCTKTEDFVRIMINRLKPENSYPSRYAKDSFGKFPQV
jgi:hypothetical protein